MKRTPLIKASNAKYGLPPGEQGRKAADSRSISSAAPSWTKYADSRLKLFGTVRS